MSPASVSEDGATNLTFTVTRSLNLSSPTTVNITTSGTATSGTDYTGGVATVTIPAGATTATITINPSVDGTVEPDETVTLTVAAGVGYTVGAPASATGTILNDDVPSATIAVSPASVAEDGAPNLVYTVTLNQASFSPVSINFTIGGTATNGTDYATITSPLVIPAGNTTGTITVNPTADTTIEADETVIITLAAGVGYTVGVPNSATGTILNDDLPNLTINDVTASEGNAGTTNFTFTVSLSAPAGPGGVTFNIATANGTATAGVDYVAQSLTGQTIPAGSSTYTFTVQVNGDTLNESSETFFVNVTGVTGAVVVDGQGVGTITNDDPLPSLSINNATVIEGNSGTVNAVFTVTLSAASGQTVTVNYATADGTATQPTDYTSTSGTLTFTAGQTTRTITVPVIGDTTPEANETFVVNLSGATNATISVNQGTGTITNDDVPVTVNPATLPNATVAAAYSQTITAAGGISPYSLAVTSGALPAGLTLATSGALSGTPTAGGTFNFTVTATDSSPFPGPFAGARAYTLVVAPPTVTLAATTLANGTLGQSLTRAITAASGGTAPYSYALTAGALPPGLALNSTTGAITSTPTALGTFNFTITATDSSTGTGPYTATRAYSMAVVAVPPVAANVAQSFAYDAAATAVTLSLSGGTATSVAIGTAPTHGTAIATGTAITYQPTAGYAGPDSFTYTASNSGGTSVAATVTVTVLDPVVTITASSNLPAAVTSAFTRTFTFNGGAQPWSGFGVTGLPAGLSTTGSTANSVTISGTPTQAGSFTLNVSAADSSTGNGPFTVGQAFTLAVNAPTLALTPAAGTFTAPYGAAFTQSFTASGGVGPYTYARTGTLPPGLSFSGDTLSGTATTPGSFSFTVTATDTGSTGTGAPFTVALNYTVNVAAPTIVVNPATLPNPTVGAAYSQTVTATGGVASHSFAVTSGSVPSGITLTTGGLLSGTTNQVGTFNFTVTASDANGQTGARAYSVTVAAPTLSMTPPAGTFTATFGTPYSQVFAASGSAGPFSYALTGTTPPGLTLTGATLSGTPTAGGTYPITVTATDTVATGIGAPFTVARNYTLTVNTASQIVTFAPATPVAFGVGPITLSATASSGLTVFTFASTTPSVCTVNVATVTIVGTGNCALSATQLGNGNYSSATANATVVVNAASQTVTFAPATPVVFGVSPITLTATASSGLTPLTFASTTPSVCTVAGNTLTVVGAGNCALSATQLGNGNYSSATANATVVVNAASQTVTFAPATPVVFGVSPITLTATASSGLTPFTFASTTPAVCTVAGNTLTIVATGNCALSATQAGNGNYSSATANATVVVNAASQTVTFAPATPVVFGVSPITLTATASSGLTPFTFASTTPAVCTVAGNTLTIVATGNCALSATQAGNGNYSSATANATVVVNAANQTVTFAPVTPVIFGVSPITLTATASSGLTTFTFASTTPSVCTVAGNTLTIVGTGNCALSATQAGNGNYSSASANATVVVNAANQTVTFAPVTPVVFGVSPITLTATASSGLTPFTFASTTPTVCTVAGNTLTIVATGNCALSATQAGNGNYSSATANATVVVNAASQTVTFAPATPVVFGVSPVTLTATATSGLTTFTFASTTPSVCTVAGNTLTVVATGNCALSATQPGNTSYTSASANATVVVNATVPGAPTIGAATVNSGQASIAFTPPAFTGGSAITGYTASCAPGTAAATGAASPLIVTGLTNGTTYTCSVVATNAVGSGAASATVSVTPSFRTYTAVSPTGAGTITATFSGGGAACSFVEPKFIPLTGDPLSPPAGSAPEGVTFRYGLFDFSTTGCTPGSTINMTMSYPGPVDVSTQYWKYGPTSTDTKPHWYVIPSTVGPNSISFAITDGGVGDDDLLANGTVVDQGGAGVPPAVPVPTLSSAALLLMLLAMLGVAGAGLRRETSRQ